MDETNTADTNLDAPRLTMTDAIVLLGLVLSGFAALVYAVTWTRKACLVFGSTSTALSTVLAALLGGWALGSLIFAGYSVRTQRPLRMYGLLQIALGLLAVASPVAFALAEQMYGSLYPQIACRPASLSLLAIAGIVLLWSRRLPVWHVAPRREKPRSWHGVS